MKRNVTLKLDAQLLKEARVLAAEGTRKVIDSYVESLWREILWT